MGNGNREQWASRFGFILAAAGSAVGLGNIWRFSYVAGDQGGAAFVLIYLIAIILIGYPLMVTEIAIGRKTQQSPIGAFKSLAPDTPWWLTGALGVLAAFVILSFYSVVAGWSLAYTFKAIGGFVPGLDYETIFVEHITDVFAPIFWHALFMILTLLVITAGVVKGIQRWAKILMPMLFVILIALVLRGLTLEGASAGVSFYLSPDFGEITGETFLTALGQAFFTLSLGMGVLITYGSYLPKRENVSDSAGWVIGMDTMVALLAGFAIFPAVFSLGFDPAGGVGLAFITLPAVFAEMPWGGFFGFLFFLLLSIAALTSAFSLLEVVVAWLIDEKGWDRIKASLLVGFIIFLLGLPPTLGYSLLSHVNILGMDILDTYDFISGNILLPLGGLLTSIFAGYVWKSKNVIAEANNPKGKIIFGEWYGYIIQYLLPLAIGAVLIWGIVDTFFLS
ncbi:sodium-dependent transporter [Heliorestis acidaminivorans]|uniref:Sodium-dependent transporter n=1 Tax=Heliorestis acidaminivorans TaxID=553427 RepID=A0A6I0EZK7_9FIRM|nr:sodium-dependent transporter [Heliorestis acidaminivorans]KAB2952389.1 sodium-dependent transporter [Heliorestis acidaminivorans]